MLLSRNSFTFHKLLLGLMEENSLCIQCALLLVCDRAIEQNKKVFYCEKYQRSNSSSVSYQSINKEKSTIHIKNEVQNGLCCICQNREICKIKIPLGGVWHCENFI